MKRIALIAAVAAAVLLPQTALAVSIPHAMPHEVPHEAPHQVERAGEPQGGPVESGDDRKDPSEGAGESGEVKHADAPEEHRGVAGSSSMRSAIMVLLLLAVFFGIVFLLKFLGRRWSGPDETAGS